MLDMQPMRAAASAMFRQAGTDSCGSQALDDAGMSRTSVRSTVLSDLKGISRAVVGDKPVNWILNGDGREIAYSAFRLSDGSINVVRITTR